MNWAKSMAGSVDEAANSQDAGDHITAGHVAPGAWDPHQVWLTRVKQPRDQPRDGRHPPSNPAPVKLPSQTSRPHFWKRALR